MNGTETGKYAYAENVLRAFTQQMTIRVGSQTIVLNHNPFLAYGGAYRNVWQLFGHVHSGPLSGKGRDIGSTSGKDLPRLAHLFPRQYDVGVDNNDFRPVSFKEVKFKNDIQVNALSNHI